MMEDGFITYTAVHHQMMIRMFWLLFWVALKPCIFIYIYSITICEPSRVSYVILMATFEKYLH